MKALVGLVLVLISHSFLHAQTSKAFTKAMKELRGFAKKDSASVQVAVNKWWEARKKNDQVPLTSPDSAAFLFRGAATSVGWAGDFNGWGSKPSPAKGVRIRNTDIWVSAFKFPAAARLDYKIIINGKDWILDPVNPHQQYSGVGGGSPNSEIRMPGWSPDQSQLHRLGPDRGPLSSSTLQSQRIYSKQLGYEVGYVVFQPGGIVEGTALPTLYVTDGSEYLDPRLGNMKLVLDNLIIDKKIPPIRVVFVDARDPSDLQNNRRMQEMSLNEKYLNFFALELIPSVEGSGAAVGQPNDRGILGTSLGGLNAAYFAFTRPELFNRVGIQSPAFWYKPEIYSIVEQSGAKSMRISMTAGNIYDTSEAALKMKAVLERLGHSCRYLETPEGHSWGNWRNLLDDLLVTLYGQ